MNFIVSENKRFLKPVRTVRPKLPRPFRCSKSRYFSFWDITQTFLGFHKQCDILKKCFHPAKVNFSLHAEDALAVLQIWCIRVRGLCNKTITISTRCKRFNYFHSEAAARGQPSGIINEKAPPKPDTAVNKNFPTEATSSQLFSFGTNHFVVHYAVNLVSFGATVFLSLSRTAGPLGSH